MLSASQLTIPDPANESLDPTCHYSEMKPFQLNQASRTPDF
jgi:hypothetical protein